MKLFLILTSFMLFIQNDSFYEKVLNDFESDSRFLVINANCSEYRGDLVIQNDKLFYFLNQKKNLNKIEYKLFVEEKLKKNLTFELGTTNLMKWNFIKVSKLKKVENNTKKGIKNFIKHYFDNNNVLKDGISDEERTVIIMILFKHQLLSYIDDETGYLVIQ